MVMVKLSRYKQFFYGLPHSSFSSKYSKHLHAKTVRAADLNFSENVHIPERIAYEMSRVMVQVSCVMCWHIFFYKVVELVGLRVCD